MAVSLKARISLVDKFSGPMRKIERQVERNQRTLDKMRQKANQTSSAMDKMNTSSGRAGTAMRGFNTVAGKALGGVGRLASALNPLNSGFLGIASAVGAAYGAIKVFDATVGEAMKMQQSQIVIGAMFDDKKLSTEYMKMLDKMAIKSPLMDSQQMYGNSKSFITASKDLGQLEQMWGLVERLMASDPQQGLEGAIFALRELFSGDAISIVDRFELPRKVMNDIKNLPLDEQLTALDKYFNKIGITTDLIDEMGGSALGMWAQVKERFQLVMRDMGEPSLKAVSKFLGGLLDRLEGEDMKKFAEWGGRVIENMVSGLSSRAIRLYDWFTVLANSEEFKKKSTLFGKVEFILEDVGDKLNNWYENGGKDKIMKFGSDIAEVLLAVLNNSKGFAEVGVSLGKSLADGIMQGIESVAKESTIGKIFNGASKVSIFGAWDHAKNTWNSVSQKQTKGFGVTGARSRQTGGVLAKPKSRGLGGSRSHSAGLDRVPYNGYQPILHKDEKVLNAQEARSYREGGKGVTITGNTFNIREEADINKIAMQLARLIEREGGQMV